MFIAQLDHTIVKLRVTPYLGEPWRQIWVKTRGEPFGTNFLGEPWEQTLGLIFGVNFRNLRNLGANLRQTLVASPRGKPWWQTLVANLGGKPCWRTLLANLGGKPWWQTFVFTLWLTLDQPWTNLGPTLDQVGPILDQPWENFRINIRNCSFHGNWTLFICEGSIWETLKDLLLWTEWFFSWFFFFFSFPISLPDPSFLRQIAYQQFYTLYQLKTIYYYRQQQVIQIIIDFLWTLDPVQCF